MEKLTSKQLISEELHYEYKKAKGGLPKSVWETYSAFANSDGGYIFLGVEEVSKRKYVPVGLSEEEIMDLKSQLFSLANNKEKVNVNLLTDGKVEEVLVDNLLALRIRIDRCPVELKPVFINNNPYQGTYRRNVDGDYHCEIEEVNAMIRDSSNKALDLNILEDYTLSSLDIESINRYRNLFASLRPTHPFLKESNEKFLEFIGALRLNKNNEYRPTIAGLLMFGYSYRIVYEFNDYFLDYQEITDSNNRWNDRIESTSGEWNGNIFTFFEKVNERLTENIKKPFIMNGIYRNDDNEMIKAIREALCNTLCNADYHLIGGVVIKQYKSYIEFTNPGCLMMDINNMLKGGTSLPRNKALLKMFNLIGIGERSGSGIPLIFSASKTFKLPTPIIKEYYKPDRTTLVLHYDADVNKDDNSSLTNLEQVILDYLRVNSPSSAKEISEYLNKNITTIKLCLYGLVEKALVTSTGTIRDKKYLIK